MPNADLLIQDGVVLTLDSKRKIFEKGAVAVRGNKIVAVGESEEIKSQYPAAKTVIDARNKLVMPGLINTHVHMFICAPKGIRSGNYGYGNPFLQRLYKILDSPYWTPERHYRQGILSAAEMIKNGTTSFVDLGTAVGAEEAGIRLVTESGMRAALALESMDIFDYPGYHIEEGRRKAFGSTRENIDRTDKYIKKYHGAAGGRIHIWTSVMQVMNSSDELIKGLRGLMNEHHVGISVHANVMRPMTEVVEKAWGKPDTHRLYDLGALGPDCLLAHACDLNGRELMMVRDTHTNLSHQIFTSMNLAYGAALFSRFPQWLEMGINISLGTDDQCCCNHMDMFRAINATFLVHKEAQFDSNLWQPVTVLEMATRNAAKSMMMEDQIGSLEAGKKADIITIDLMTPEWVPWHKFNLIENLVLSATGASVNTNIIDGKIVMENRQIKTFNERKVLEDMQADIGELLNTLDFLGPDKPYPENMPPLW